MKRQTLDALLAARAGKVPVVLATRLATGDQWILQPLEPRPLDVPEALFDAARRALAQDRSSSWTPEPDAAAKEQAANRIALPEGPWFLQVHAPPRRMVLVGAVHTAQPLARMAAVAGYEVIVVDPREAFANELRFPGIARSTDWPDEALTALAPDARTAVITLTHDPKLDDPALVAALGTPAFYLGCLGSRRTHAARLDRLRNQHGFDDEALARLHGPVGLPIGARSPAEVAVSILAEVTAVLHGISSSKAAPAPPPSPAAAARPADPSPSGRPG
jgi:xanthine dehydrogenase accessory factor